MVLNKYAKVNRALEVIGIVYNMASYEYIRAILIKNVHAMVTSSPTLPLLPTLQQPDFDVEAINCNIWNAEAQRKRNLDVEKCTDTKEYLPKVPI